MGRMRTLKPEFFRSKPLARCSIPARLTFEGLWCEADDYGRGDADARVLKGHVWPLDDDITWQIVEGHLGELEREGCIVLYEVDGNTYYAIPSWEKHQAAAYRRGKAIYPEPPCDNLHDDACKEMQAAPLRVLELGTGNEEVEASQATVAVNGSPKKRATRIPDEFIVTPEMETWARSKCPDIDWVNQTERFVNHWKAKSGKDALKLDWDRTWKNWLLQAQDWVTKRSPVRTHL